MSLYAEKIFPLINDLLTKQFRNHRKKLFLPITGDVLEIGFGSGLSVSDYPATVKRVTGLEPNPGMRKKAAGRVSEHSRPAVELCDGVAEAIPFPDGRLDAVVSVLTLCSVTDLKQSAREIHRVLKPGGKLFFLEHARQSHAGMTRKLQNLLDPAWNRFACGCHLNRDTLVELEAAGLEIEEKKVIGYDGFPNFLSPIYRGVARRS